MAVGPPNAQATRSNSNKPTRPQLIQPIMLKIKQILSNIFFTPLSLSMFILCLKFQKLYSNSKNNTQVYFEKKATAIAPGPMCVPIVEPFSEILRLSLCPAQSFELSAIHFCSRLSLSPEYP